MEGRESRQSNDLFFTCSLISYIARKTKNTPRDIVSYLGMETLKKIYDLADVYHSDNIERVCEDFVEEKSIKQGDFDNVSVCRFSVPTHWDIGKVYKRLVLMAAEWEHQDVIEERRAVSSHSARRPPFPILRVTESHMNFILISL